MTMRHKLRAALFQFHWLFGISAGLVLAIMGVTGATLSFETEILELLNPKLLRVSAQEQPLLSPMELITRVQRNASSGSLGSISHIGVSSDPAAAARVGFVRQAQAKDKPRVEWHYLNPYTGVLLGSEHELRGHALLHLLEDIHRKLAAGKAGKTITGASTLILVYLCLSGLYLRWPRHARNWRAWLQLHWKRKARHFLWELHTVAGTWLLLAYLLSALTGLYWAYDWYRDGLYALSNTPRPERQPPPASDRPPIPDLARAWTVFLQASGGFSVATLRLPDAAVPDLQILYLPPTPAHDRAFGKLSADPATGRISLHEPYAGKTVGGKFISSIFPLHSGSFFGMPGRVLIMLSSLAMPLFAISGWMLYLDRRRKKKRSREIMRQRASAAATPQAAPGSALSPLARGAGSTG